jgi:hypothetical protein
VRVLLDENLPVGLVPEFADHEVETVSRLGWSGITSGELTVLADIQPGELVRVGA